MTTSSKIATLAALVAAACPGAALAAPVALVPAHITVATGRAATWDVSLASTARCSARLSRNGKNLRLATIAPLVAEGVATRAAIKLRTTRATKPGLYSVTLSCADASPTNAALRVRRARFRPSAGRGAPSMLFRVTAVGPFTLDELRARAAQAWARNGPRILAGYRNGQCTDWAAHKRPDLIQRVEEANYIAQYQHRQTHRLADALTWASVAAASGLTVQETPAAGSLVVWQPGVEGANAGTGHVGYVETVSADGSTFATSEMNVGSPYSMGYRNRSSIPVAGRQFVLP